MAGRVIRFEHSPWPRRGEEHRGEGDHHPPEQADLEEHERGEVEGDDGGVGERARAPPEQPADDRQVEQRPRPTHRERGPRLLQDAADERQVVGAIGQPQPHRQGVQHPVRVELGEPGEHVDDAQLQPQRPHRPRRHPVWAALHARAAAGGDRRQPQRGEGHEPVVVEVQRGVDQLDVGEADGEQEGGEAGAVPGGDAQPEQGEGDDERVHRDRRQRPHPVEAGVGQVLAPAGGRGAAPSRATRTAPLRTWPAARTRSGTRRWTIRVPAPTGERRAWTMRRARRA